MKTSDLEIREIKFPRKVCFIEICEIKFPRKMDFSQLAKLNSRKNYFIPCCLPYLKVLMILLYRESVHYRYSVVDNLCIILYIFYNNILQYFRSIKILQNEWRLW